MKPMDPETIRHIERLARIELAPDERERLVEELGRIIEYAGELRGVDADGGGRADGGEAGGKGPLGGACDAGHRALSRVRPDIPGECVERGIVLGGAPDTDARKGLFRVPRVVQK